ncbi:MotA/TolQ/ExbB proton channel family protein [Methylobacterium nonmethylotrophicum]|uniref:Flagellar motor protein MotA n=1 Tax=Methylobacterium nonmethylotrophicum TaxID=1141884 RepID=A0A4Z0NU10_9HYPH|nr:MotA/TolQ/ExbB proton channel family protein [Methylobacterium nonmethylotrophicum]TGE00269.1 flagellar motor protein MotA [Methylobacterium nonmethylotrophicum]
MAASAASPPLTSPRIYLIRMAVFLTLAGFLAFVLYRQIVPAFMANPGLNGLILGATLIAVLMAFGQVQRLFREVRFANRTAAGAPDAGSPRVLAALAPALREARTGRAHPQAQFQPLLDSVASRLDEGREILRYIGGLLILLGLLGTFWGLIDTLSAVGGVIRSMRAGGGDAAVMFDELKSGLAVPLSGIGLAFSASLFGLAGSLVIGFLDLQAGQAHTRFYNELEDWLVTAAGPAPAPVPVPVTVPAAAQAASSQPAAAPRPPEPVPVLRDPRSEAVLKDLADAMTRLGTLVGDSTTHGRSSTQAMANLAEGIQGLVQHMRAEQQMIRDWVEAQANRERELKQVLERLAREKVE